VTGPARVFVEDLPQRHRDPSAAFGRNQNLSSRQDAKHAKKTKTKTCSNLGDLGVFARDLTSLSVVTYTASCERRLPGKTERRQENRAEKNERRRKKGVALRACPASFLSPFFVSFGYGGLGCGRRPRCALGVSVVSIRAKQSQFLQSGTKGKYFMEKEL